MTAKRRIGDREVYPVGLGCMNITHAYGPPMDEADAKGLLVRALDAAAIETEHDIAGCEQAGHAGFHVIADENAVPFADICAAGSG